LASIPGEPSLGEGGYQALGVRRTARICVAGYGGKILLSNASRELIEDELSDDLALVTEEGIGLRISSGQSGFSRVIYPGSRALAAVL
jgi:hypothetical protein